MAVQSKKQKSHKTDALMRLLVSGSSGAVNPSVSVSFKEDIIRPINDKKNAPKTASLPETDYSAHQNIETQRFQSKPIQQTPAPRIVAPEMPKPAVSAAAPLEIAESSRPALAVPRINPDKPVELDIVTELTKELLPTAIQRFNVCYCDTCYQAMTEAVAKRSPKIIVMVRSKDDLARAEYLKKQNRNNVLRTVIKEVLEYKTTGRHNNIDIRK
jgi:hypothetical protein